MSRVVEIRAYRLKPGTKEAFHRLASAESVPLVRRWGTDVVAYGPSMTRDDAYVLVRAYADTDELRKKQDAFYASASWRDGPRQAILDLIDEQISVVFEADDSAIDALRGTFRALDTAGAAG